MDPATVKDNTGKHWEHVHHLTLQLEFYDNHVATLGEVSGGRACIELEGGTV